MAIGSVRLALAGAAQLDSGSFARVIVLNASDSAAGQEQTKPLARAAGVQAKSPAFRTISSRYGQDRPSKEGKLQQMGSSMAVN